MMRWWFLFRRRNIRGDNRWLAYAHSEGWPGWSMPRNWLLQEQYEA